MTIGEHIELKGVSLTTAVPEDMKHMSSAEIVTNIICMAYDNTKFKVSSLEVFVIDIDIEVYVDIRIKRLKLQTGYECTMKSIGFKTKSKEELANLIKELSNIIGIQIQFEY